MYLIFFATNAVMADNLKALPPNHGYIVKTF